MYKLLVCVSSIVLCISLFLLILFSQHCGFFKKIPVHVSYVLAWLLLKKNLSQKQTV